MRVWAKDDKILDLEEIKRLVRSSLRLHEIPDEIVQERNDVFHK